MTEPFKKSLHIGRHEDGAVFVDVEWTADGRLSLSGVVGPMRNGNARGSCGQMQAVLKDDIAFAPGWDRATADQLHEVWGAWHLNDMQAGTVAQTAHLKDGPFITGPCPGYPTSHYKWACEELRRAGLNPDDGYSYGSAWLRVEVPVDVLAWLVALPHANKANPWDTRS